jgi:hypothetical protein
MEVYKSLKDGDGSALPILNDDMDSFKIPDDYTDEHSSSYLLSLLKKKYRMSN